MNALALWATLAAAQPYTPATIVWTLDREAVLHADALHDVVHVGIIDANYALGVAHLDSSDSSVTVEFPADPRAWSRPYAAHLGPVLGSRLLCDAYDRLAIVDCTSREALVEGDRLARVEDATGDGLDDILGWDGLYINDGDSFRFSLYPVSDDPLPEEVGDIDGDGAMDIALTEIIEPDTVAGYTFIEQTRIAFHRGGPDGYQATPSWTVDLDGIIFDAVAVQADDDPVREVLVAMVDELIADKRSFPVAHLALIDFQEGSGIGTVRSFPEIFFISSHWLELWQPILDRLGDVDGDGLEEAIVQGAFKDQVYDPTVEPSEFHRFRIVGSATDWDIAQPLLGLPLSTEGGAESGFLHGFTHDLNGDGRLDLVAVRENNEWHSSPDSFAPTTVQVWYAPWLEPDPEPPHTADTGTTSTAAPTADTGTPAGNDVPVPSSSGTEEEPRCGCSSPPPFALPSYLARRRAPGGLP